MRKNPFSKDETSWLRKTADEHGGRIRSSDDDALEALFSDEESAESFRTAVENSSEVTSLKAIDQSILSDADTGELVDVMLTIWGSDPPNVKSSFDWTTYALLAGGALAAYLIYKKSSSP